MCDPNQFLHELVPPGRGGLLLGGAVAGLHRPSAAGPGDARRHHPRGAAAAPRRRFLQHHLPRLPLLRLAARLHPPRAREPGAAGRGPLRRWGRRRVLRRRGAPAVPPAGESIQRGCGARRPGGAAADGGAPASGCASGEAETEDGGAIVWREGGGRGGGEGGCAGGGGGTGCVRVGEGHGHLGEHGEEGAGGDRSRGAGDRDAVGGGGGGGGGRG